MMVLRGDEQFTLLHWKGIKIFHQHHGCKNKKARTRIGSGFDSITHGTKITCYSFIPIIPPFRSSPPESQKPA
jgi:hypothetical protein